jgi:hypothetical protein
MTLAEIVYTKLLTVACPIYAIKANDSLIWARDGTGPHMGGGVNAYMHITDIDLSSDVSIAVATTLLPVSWPLRWMFSYSISSLRLQSIAGEPLELYENENGSNYQGEEKISVYKGRLKLSWTQARIFLLPIFSSSLSSVVDVTLTLRFRMDNANSSLDCYDAADADDNNALICADLTGILDNPILGFLKFLMVNAKSNRPVRFEDPVDFRVRKTKLSVCFAQLF